MRFVAALVLSMGLLPPAAGNSEHDYPTAARADYVFGCMASSGQTQVMLYKCSCSIDVIASLLPFAQYVQAETILRMRTLGGEKTAMFRGSPWMSATVDALKAAQAEAELECF